MSHLALGFITEGVNVVTQVDSTLSKLWTSTYVTPFISFF